MFRTLAWISVFGSLGLAGYTLVDIPDKTPPVKVYDADTIRRFCDVYYDWREKQSDRKGTPDMDGACFETQVIRPILTLPRGPF